MITKRGSTFSPDLAFLIGVPLVAVLSGAIFWISSNRGTPWIVAYAISIFLMVAGAVKLFRAKLPLYRQKRFFTWGPKGLPEASVPLYWRAIRLILAGMVAAVLLLLPKLTLG